MDRATLQKIFSSPFSQTGWPGILHSIFGVRQLLSQPKQIPLPNQEKAEAAYELGSFNTVDDRIIGLYLVKVKPEVWLERNKVGLRELLRNVYKYDVDGALIVFDQGDKWRLSFVSDIKVLNDEGEVVKQATEPKRFTYLLGEDEKVRTPAERLSKLAGKKLYLNDILNAFSVESLNEEFYKVVQKYFYELVGGRIGKGRNAIDFGNGILELPTDNHNICQEFAVRLIGRTVFCWFLKMKKSDDGVSLLPENLLSSAAVKKYPDYYHQVLERMFFQTLNTPMSERMNNLPEGSEVIPFLNGGLFEPNEEDYYKPVGSSGLNISQVSVPDNWFLGFLGELEKYNFTIDENSVTEIEVSVDPEMLGRIFENLLAEIDPDSGETARKATGSFYTPREIVDYMATESLVQHLHNQTGIEQNKLRPVFKMLDYEDSKLTPSDKNEILEALDKIKILDPACGSGAFPMGVLQKVVQALQKLDPDAKWWKKRQIDRISNVIVRKQLKEKLASSGVEYARKIGVIQNSLYGVDIQPIAAEISKLRCFLSLIVDENIDEKLPNRGIEPLPNLEFKFVTADTLISLPEENQRSMFDNYEELQQLEELRNEYIQSYGINKVQVKDQFLKVQRKIAKDQSSLFADTKSKAFKLGNWNPFGHDKNDWFDPKWMFGVEKFDVVIGNPPYIKEYTNKAAFDGIRGQKYYQGKMDIWYYFACHLFDFLTENGNLTFIATNNWVTNAGASKLRDKIVEDCKIVQFVDFGNTKVFSSADIQTMILIAENTREKNTYSFSYKCVTKEVPLKEAFNMLNGIPGDMYSISDQLFDRSLLKGKSFAFNTSENDKLLEMIKAKQNFILNPGKEITNGIHPHYDFVSKQISEKSKGEFLKGQGIFGLSHKEKDSLSLNKEELNLIKPYYNTSEQLKRYYGNSKNSVWIIYTTSDFKNPDRMKDYPNLKNHLDRFRDIITSDNKPYGLHRSRVESFFVGEKIVSLRKATKPTFTYTDFDCYASAAFYIIKTERINQKYLTALFNSKLVEFWLRFRGKMQGFNFQIDKAPLLEIPIFKPDSNSTKVFEILVDYIRFILSMTEGLNAQVPNNHIAQLFEDVIDAMIMELYFKEQYEKENLEFIRYAEFYFKDIDGKNKNDSIDIINSAYQALREKDNIIRNNLKLMDIKLADIVMPIKTAGK